MKIISIRISDTNCFNVFFKDEQEKILVDQCYNDERTQRFKFSDIQQLLIDQPDLLDKPLPEIEIEPVSSKNED